LIKQAKFEEIVKDLPNARGATLPRPSSPITVRPSHKRVSILRREFGTLLLQEDDRVFWRYREDVAPSSELLERAMDLADYRERKRTVGREEKEKKEKKYVAIFVRARARPCFVGILNTRKHIRANAKYFPWPARPKRKKLKGAANCSRAEAD